jgi:hypothetical protein
MILKQLHSLLIPTSFFLISTPTLFAMSFCLWSGYFSKLCSHSLSHLSYMQVAVHLQK